MKNEPQSVNADIRSSSDAERRVDALETSLANANRRIRKLASEKANAITIAAAVRSSLSFRLGALVIFPLRLIRNPRTVFRRERGIEIPTKDDIEAWSAPEGPELLGGVQKPLNDIDHTPRIHHDYGATKKDKESSSSLISKLFDPRFKSPTQAVFDQSSREFYKRNGFAVFRNIFDHQQCEELAHGYKDKYVDKDYLEKPHTTLNLAVVDPVAEDMVFDPRILVCLKKCIGSDVKFLQWSTYQLNHMSFAWHRDSPFREFGIGCDWDESVDPYRVAKIIVYLECTDFALAVYPGTHLKDVDKKQISDQRDDFDEIACEHTAVASGFGAKPCAIHAGVGDAIVFDERLMHCGKLLDSERHQFTRAIKGDKSFLSFIYGADNPHSHRFYSYFHMEREFSVDPMSDALMLRLAEHNLKLTPGQTNHFDSHPEDRKGIWLPIKVAEASNRSESEVQD